MRLSAAQRALVERSARGPVGVVGAFASGKSTCAAQRVLWLDSQRGRRVLALSGKATDAAPLVALLDHATTFHALERRGHRVVGAMEWTQHTLEELGMRADTARALSFGALTAFLMHHANALPLRAFHQKLATASSMQLRRTVADMVRFFTTLEAHGVLPDTYVTFAVSCASETGDESHLELAHAYVVYQELQQRHDVRSWDGLVLDLQRAFASDPHSLDAATREFSDVVIDDLDRMTPVMVQTLALVLGQPHLKSSMSFSHSDPEVSDECARMNQLHELLKTLQPESVHLTSDHEKSWQGCRAGVRHVAAQVLTVRSTATPLSLPVREARSIPVVISLESDTFEDETRAVAALIKRRRSSASPCRVTVFCPSKADVDAVSLAFLSNGIRVNGRAGVDATRRLLFDEPGVDTLFSLLVALWSPSDTKHLYNVLGSEFVAFPPLVLSRLMETTHRRSSHSTLTDVLTSFVDSKGLQLCGIDDDTRLVALVAAENFLEIVGECRDKCHRKSVAEIVQLFLERVGHLDRLLDPQTPRDARQAIALAALLREIDAAQRIVQSAHVPFIVPYLMQLQAARVVSISSDDDDSDRESTNLNDQEDVHVLPLTRYDLDEYEAGALRGRDDTPSEDRLVVLMSMRDAKFPGRLKRITWPLPKDLMAEPLPVQTRAEFLADAEKLVYDALVQLHPTEIVISYTKAVAGGASKKQQEKLSRVLEPLWTTPTDDEKNSPSGGGDQLLTPSSRAAPPGIHIATTRHPATAPAAHAFEPSHLSYSQIAEYQRCPHQYYLSRVLGLRELAAAADENSDTNLAMMFGSAVHEAVAAFGAVLQCGGALDVAKEEAFRVLGSAWRREGFLSKQQEAFFLERAQSTLRGFVGRDDTNAQILAVEQTFECRLGRRANVALRGVWDRVDRTQDGAVVIREFKTNPSAQRRTNMDSAAAESLQLQIYLVAYEQLHGEAPRGATLEVLEEQDETNAVGFVAYARGLRERVDDTIDRTMDAIQSGHFDATPSFMACAMCPYASSVCRANVATEASE